MRVEMMGSFEHERLLTPAEVAALFRVDPKTVTRWAQAGKLTAIRTLGGHRRYRESEVSRLLEAGCTGGGDSGRTHRSRRLRAWASVSGSAVVPGCVGRTPARRD